MTVGITKIMHDCYGISMYELDREKEVNTSLKWPEFVIGLLKQNTSLCVIRFLENKFL